MGVAVTTVELKLEDLLEMQFVRPALALLLLSSRAAYRADASLVSPAGRQADAVDRRRRQDQPLAHHRAHQPQVRPRPSLPASSPSSRSELTLSFCCTGSTSSSSPHGPPARLALLPPPLRLSSAAVLSSPSHPSQHLRYPSSRPSRPILSAPCCCSACCNNRDPSPSSSRAPGQSSRESATRTKRQRDDVYACAAGGGTTARGEGETRDGEEGEGGGGGRDASCETRPRRRRPSPAARRTRAGRPPRPAARR